MVMIHCRIMSESLQELKTARSSGCHCASEPYYSSPALCRLMISTSHSPASERPRTGSGEPLARIIRNFSRKHAKRMRAVAAILAAVNAAASMPWQDWTLPIEERLDDLLGRLTVEEQINQTWSIAPAISRLGIPAYNWCLNCVHGRCFCTLAAS